jgi:hypothetical protein
MIKIWKKNVKNETKIHYQFLETKIPTTRFKEHFEFQFELKSWDGPQMIIIKFIFYILI